MPKILSWFLALTLTSALPALAGQAAPAKAAQAKAPAAVVNLNTASESNLVALPGVGPATAKKIIAGRPYTSVADLATAGVPKNTIEKISSMVTVGAATSAAAAPPAPKPARAPAAPAQAPATSTTTRTPSTPTAAQQPPSKGMVWVNLSTKVFHREGDRYYGNTKSGKFMTEADAVKAGYREAKTEEKKTP
jgi:Helix-hairpin-helix motif